MYFYGKSTCDKCGKTFEWCGYTTERRESSDITVQEDGWVDRFVFLKAGKSSVPGKYRMMGRCTCGAGIDFLFQP